MSVRVTPRARSRPDRGGDPLDGLVNLFDLGVVLSLAFLLAALSSLNLSGLLTHSPAASPGQVTAPKGAQVHQVTPSGRQVVGTGKRVGSVYRLADGRIVYVQGR